MVLKTVSEFTNDSEQELFSALAAGATVVTANNRLARHIALLWGRRQHAQGAVVWESPDVLPWTAFISRAADAVREGHATRMAPLSDAQERWLWADLVRAQDTGFLCADQAFGDLAAQAWRLLADHALPLPPENGSPETAAFIALARAFTSRLRTLQREDRARDGARVVAALNEGTWVPPALLVWVGFQFLTPMQRQVSDACATAGSVCQVLALPQGQAVVQARVFATVEDELTAALLWARDKLAHNPHGRYALVMPAIEGHRLRMMRLADEIFAVTDPVGVRPYGVSLGGTLMDAPVVACAVRIWRLIQAPLDPLEAALLMQSPFVSGALAERGARSQAAYTALAEGVALDLRAWAALARSVEAREGAAIAMRLASVVRAWPARERASVWASLMMNALGILGWPGAAGQAEYQAVAALRDVLESVAGLDAVATPMSYDQALVLVQEALAGRVFQAGESEAPLQIMGPLEAVGLSFDGLWVLNLQDRVWPAIRQPHPLLPLTFQREHHLPHADIEDDVRYTQALTSAFVGAAPEVCLSAARHDGIDPQRPSRVLEAYAPQDASAPPFAGRAARLFASRPSLEDIPETKAPLREPRKGGYGVGLFAAQAGCPFKAAAQYRLQADPLAAPTYGLAPSVRGDLLHIALEQLFRGLPDQAALTALSAGAKEQQVKAAVEGALAYAPEAYHGLPKAFVVLEAKRYQDLLRDFLALEESRAPFRVQACEQEVKFACGPLTARGRIDRIDEIAGELVLIDYKTGKVPVLDWTSERPLHPQLLFYATAQGPAVAGFAYASLSAQGSRYKAWTRVADLLPGATVIPEWTQMAASWPGILRHLAEEFAAGHAAVDPEPGACDYCGRESFCRVGQWGPDDDR